MTTTPQTATMHDLLHEVNETKRLLKVEKFITSEYANENKFYAAIEVKLLYGIITALTPAVEISDAEEEEITAQVITVLEMNVANFEAWYNTLDPKHKTILKPVFDMKTSNIGGMLASLHLKVLRDSQ